MQVWAVSVVRDEQDIIGYTLRHFIAEGIDGFVLLNHGSTDSTKDQIASAMSGKIPCVVMDDGDRPFLQGAQLTQLARIAADKGADWIIPFDADELWFARSPCNLADTIRKFDGGAVIRIPLWDHLPTTRDLDNPNPFLRFPYRRKDRFSVGKIACRADHNHIIAEGAHVVIDARTTLMPRAADGDIAIRHFPVRGFAHFVAKVRKMSEGLQADAGLPRGVGIQWRAFGGLTDDELRVIYYSRYYQTDPEDNGMVYDPAPYRADTYRVS